MHMTATLRETRTCPQCGTVWTGHPDDFGTLWQAENTFWTLRSFCEPVRMGQCYCPNCAAISATDESITDYIEEKGKHEDFLSWLVKGISKEDAEDVFSVLVKHDPELMRDRMSEYIDECANDDFVDWRCNA